MSYKLCDTCQNVVKKGLNLFSENNEEWNNFPHHLPILGEREGSQEMQIDMGKKHANCLIYYWGSRSMFENLNLEYPDSYIDSKNNGIMKLDASGKCKVSINCPQPYKDKGISYMSHIHMLVSDKKMTKWNKGMYTQNVLCEINKKNLTHHMQRKDRIVINALSSDYHDKAHIPNSHNLFYKDAKNLSNAQIHNKIRKMIKDEPHIQKLIKKNKLKITEVPIIVYCYDKHCNAGHQLANELFRAGYTNVIDYLDGTLGYFGRKRY
jgi:hypothetical protein